MEPRRVDMPKWNTSEPQLWHDSWRNADVVITFTGVCWSCGRRCYERSDGQNDPRGILGDHADHGLVADDYDMVGRDVPLCAICANEYDPYKAALAHAERVVWSAKA